MFYILNINNADSKATMIEVSVRASSWGRLLDCPHAWEAQHLLGMHKAAGMPALLGNGIHAGSAAFDQARLDASPITPSDAVAVMVDELRHPSQEYDLRDADMTLDKAAQVGSLVLSRYCREISPHYEFIAVERRLEPYPIDCGNGVTITLTGSMDRARTHKGKAGKGICDLKSGKRSVENGVAVTKKHKAQLGVYEVLEEAATGERCTLPAEIIALPTGSDSTPAVGEIHGARAALIGTATEPGLITFAAEMFRSGLFPPNPQSSLCSPKFCARWETCRFR